MFADFESTLVARSGKTGEPIALGLKNALQACPQVVDPTRPGPLTEALTRTGVASGAPSPVPRLVYVTGDGTLVLQPLRALGLR